MRAKFYVESVLLGGGQEVLTMKAVTNGDKEDNTYSRWTPSATLQMVVTNPDLHGTIKPGDRFYVDFTPAP